MIKRIVVAAFVSVIAAIGVAAPTAAAPSDNPKGDSVVLAKAIDWE